MAKRTTKPRTQKEIDAQIEGLKKMKMTLPQFSVFGDDNWGRIDAQLDVLEGEKDADDFYIDETSDEYEEGDNDNYHGAVEAEEWMNGERDEDLFE